MKSNETDVYCILALVFAFIFPPLGVVFGIIGLNELKKKPKLAGKGLAIAGIVIGSVWIFVVILIFVYFLLMFPLILTNIPNDYANGMNSGANLGESCYIAPGIACDDAQVFDNGKMKIRVTNNLDNINNFEMRSAGILCEPVVPSFEFGKNLGFTCEVNKETVGQRFLGSIEISYTGYNGNIVKNSGRIATTYKSE